MASHRYTLASPALALQTINHAEQCSVLAREVQYRPGMFDCTGRWHCAYSPAPTNVRFLRLQRDQQLTLWYIGKRKQGFLRNHAIPPCTFLTPVGNRGITPCVSVQEPSRSRGVLPPAGGLDVHKGTVCCRNIRRHIQRYWILRRICRSISC